MNGKKEEKCINYKGLNIAVIFGKGDDSCGVTRTGHELFLWSKKSKANVDLFFYDGKKYARSGSHTDSIQLYFNSKNIKQITSKINNEYDIVIFMSYPTNKHEHNFSKAFYHTLFKGISKPIKVFMMHDIHRGQIDKVTYLVPMIVNSDLVFHFDIDTWFSKTVNDLGFQKIKDRLNKYTLWMDFDELDSYRQKYKDNKDNGLVSVTRWSSLKNIRRSIDIMDQLKNLDKNVDVRVHGVERSIGAKFDILDYDKTIYVNPNGKRDNEDKGSIEVFGPVTRNEGLDIVASHLFSSSFFSLPKAPQNYGNRMEYTQIEIIGVGTIPIFDKHWGENNTLNDGRRYIDVPYSAVYTDGSDSPAVAQKLVEIANDKELAQKYLDTSYDLVKKEFDCDHVIPKTIDLIISKGKKNKYLSEFEVCDEFVNSEFAREMQKIEESGKLPVYGIGEFLDAEAHFLNGAKQELVKKCKPRKNRNVKALF